MNTRPQRRQLKELRERTDRQLIAWLEMRLDAGLLTYGAAAEQIYLEVAPLLLVANASPADRARLESKLDRLAECFDLLCATA